MTKFRIIVEILIFTMFCNYAKGQNIDLVQHLVSDDFIIVDSVLNYDNETLRQIDYNNLKVELKQWFGNVRIENYIAEEEYKLMLQNISKLNNISTWDKKILRQNNIKFIKYKKYKKKRRIIPKHSYCMFSYPLVSRSKKFAIIVEEKWCGMECGSSEIIVLVKEKDNWKVVCAIVNWIS